jgi:hypothetical protein
MAKAKPSKPAKWNDGWWAERKKEKATALPKMVHVTKAPKKKK